MDILEIIRYRIEKYSSLFGTGLGLQNVISTLELSLESVQETSALEDF